ncbi:MAG: undecaprenyl-diphosphate phosphatase [Peptostreptococcaceae bacterium]|nr:undecaprenyl-diphosphate phosphatase [Peptostreptococcaceae bacterium]
MTYLEAIVLGLIQGLTEFLPVSSSGHLTILQTLFNISGDKVIIFTVLLHVGTLISVMFMYWRDLLELIVELFVTIKDLVTGKGLKLNEKPVRKLGIMILVTTLVTAVIGLLFEDLFVSFYASLVPVIIGLVITGTLLWVSESIETGKRDIKQMNFRNAIYIGVMQGIAIIPGISRSGATLVGGLTTKLDRAFAVKYAFLISFPAILGSAVLEMGNMMDSSIAVGSVGPIVLGMMIAAISGIFAIKAMIAIVSKYSLKYFSIYVWTISILLTIYLLFIK